MAESSATKITNYRRALAATIVLAIFGVVGNVFNLPLFFSVSLIFGSVFAMLAIVQLGTVPAVIIAAAAGLYTIVIWGHPYACIIFSLEALVVGLLYRRGWNNLVLADLVYWVLLGAPLVLVFYRYFIGLPWEATSLIALKQPINGVFNALIASLILLGWQLLPRRTARKYSSPNQISGLLFHTLLTVIVLAGLVPIISQGYTNRAQQEGFLSERLLEKADGLMGNIQANPGLNIEQLQGLLENENVGADIDLAFLSNEGGVLASQGEVIEQQNRPGRFVDINEDLSLWVPTGEMASMQQWKEGRYRVVKTLANSQVAKIVVEHAAGALVIKLQKESAVQFMLLSGIVFIGIVIARLLSQWLMLPLTRLSRVVRDTTNGVIITDTKGRVEWINEGFVRITGYTLEEMVGRKPGDLLQGELTDLAVVNNMSKALQNKESFNVEVVNYNKSGQPYWIRISSNPFHDDRGKLLGFIAIESDVSDQKNSEQQLRESEARFRSVFEDAGDAFYIHNNLGKILDINQVACDQTGYSRKELLNLNVTELDTNFTTDGLKQLWETGQESSSQFPITVESSHQRKDGNVFPIEVRLSLLHKEGENLFIAVVRDVSDRKRVDQLKNEFVSTVSHELRTPLTSISGSLGLIQAGALGEVPDKAKEMIAIAHTNSQRLSYLINDLLDMEKIAAGKFEFDMQKHALGALVEQTVEANQSYGAERGVQLVYSGCNHEIVVTVDSQRLIQVMTNFLSNAIKFSPDDGQVEVSLQILNTVARVSVRDYGVGIPDEFRERIFQKFAQADATDTRQKSGTGLGLAISKELIKRMKGEIGFESCQGEGASFYFELPVLGNN